METQIEQQEVQGIGFDCKECGEHVQFPATPNYDSKRGDQIAHMIYSHWANKGVCGNCIDKSKKQKEEERKRRCEENGRLYRPRKG